MWPRNAGRIPPENQTRARICPGKSNGAEFLALESFRAATPVTNRLSLLNQVTCPHCWHVFAPEDSLWVSEHPDLVGDAKLGDMHAVRFLPSRFSHEGDAIDSEGYRATRLACPNCHLEIPRPLFQLPAVFYSITVCTFNLDARADHRPIPHSKKSKFNGRLPVVSLELLCTSATAGLRQGSRGFCTVLSTTGMPANLAQRLEMLSGYRHVFSPQEDQTAKNPISYSHVRVRLGGKSLSVLSRVAAYGTDYSGRTNKLAPHVVVESHEQSPAGPAWLLAMRSEWAGQTQTPPNGPPIPQQHQTPHVCQTWAAMTGDAGWGGYVADAMSAAATKPLWLIFDLSQSQSLLTLLDESIALLPESSRWSATFSTYYTNLPPEIECRVRCVLAGTEEARLATARGSVIDLTTNRPLAAHTPLLELARIGSSSPLPTAPSTTFQPTSASVSVAIPSPSGGPPKLIDLLQGASSFPVADVVKTSSRVTPPPQRVKWKRKSTLILGTLIGLLLLASGVAVYGIQRYASSLLAFTNEQDKAISGEGKKTEEQSPDVGQPTKPDEQAETLDVSPATVEEHRTEDIPSETQGNSKPKNPDSSVEPSNATSNRLTQEGSDVQPASTNDSNETPTPPKQDEKPEVEKATTEVSKNNSKTHDGGDEQKGVQSNSDQESKSDSTQNATVSIDGSNKLKNDEEVIELHYLLKDDGSQHISGEMKIHRETVEMHKFTSVKFGRKSDLKPIERGENIYRPGEFPSNFMSVRLQGVDPMNSISIKYDVSPAYVKKGKQYKFDEKYLDLLKLLEKLPERNAFVRDWKEVRLGGPTDSKIDTKNKEYIDKCNQIKERVFTLVSDLALESTTSERIEQIGTLVDELDDLNKNSENMPATDPVIGRRREHVSSIKKLCEEIVDVRKFLETPQKLGPMVICFVGKESGGRTAALNPTEKQMTIDPEFVLVLETETK